MQVANILPASRFLRLTFLEVIDSCERIVLINVIRLNLGFLVVYMDMSSANLPRSSMPTSILFYEWLGCLLTYTIS